MNKKLSNIDSGQNFDFGRTAPDYAKYRDIYPESLYKQLADAGIGVAGQEILDLGTGSGVLPRNMYAYGAKWSATDISVEQIAAARQLAAAKDMKIDFSVSAAENLPFAENSFDAVTACQCIWYFDGDILAETLKKILRPGGLFAAIAMEWLPFEDPVAKMSEELVLKYNPQWSGHSYTRQEVPVPESIKNSLYAVKKIEYDEALPFTYDSWNGRMKSCRGIGATLSANAVQRYSEEHLKALQTMVPENFKVLHHIAIAVFSRHI